MPEIRFESIFKRFGEVRLFEDISLACPDEVYLCLLGPSGCGKTTLMRMVAGLETPDAGDVLIGGVRVNELAPSSRDVGLAFQNYALYPHLTVAENIAFPLRAPIRRRQYDAAQVRQRVEEVARLLKIHQLLARPTNALSGGQQQRVALARALVRRPSVLLLDEPVAHLDARLRYEMRAELKTLHRRLGTTTIQVTHDQQEALAVADRIAVMRHGAVEQVGAPLEVYHRPATAFVAGFVGDPPMNLLSARLLPAEAGGQPLVEAGGVRLALPEELAPAAAAAYAGGSLTFGLRPRHVSLVEPGGAGIGDAVPAVIYSHEMIGREQQLMLSIGSDVIRYRSSEPRSVSVGEVVHVRLSLAGAALFDGISGRALAPPAS